MTKNEQLHQPEWHIGSNIPPGVEHAKKSDSTRETPGGDNLSNWIELTRLIP